jgi:hypothetical protein
MGPGHSHVNDPSTHDEDKLAFELKVDSKDTGVSYFAKWSNWVKTSFVQHADEEWKLLQVNEALNSTTNAIRYVGRQKKEEKPARTVFVIHPSSSSRSNVQRRAAVDQRKGKPAEKGKGKPPGPYSKAEGRNS